MVHVVLVDPVPEARATAAKALGTLVALLREHVELDGTVTEVSDALEAALTRLRRIAEVRTCSTGQRHSPTDHARIQTTNIPDIIYITQGYACMPDSAAHVAAFSTVVGAVSREQDAFGPEGHARRVAALLVKKQEVEAELRAYRAMVRKQVALRVFVSAMFHKTKRAF